MTQSSKGVYCNAFRILNFKRLYTIYPPLTKEVYPKLERSSRYAQTTSDDIAYFKKILPDTGVIADHDDMMRYNVDWMRKYRGQSSVVLRPSSTSEISNILRYCQDHSLAVVPQGGNTGLVGGGVPVFDEIIVSTELMNKIHSFDPVSGSVVCDAGCILETLDAHLALQGHMVPLDLGAKGSCHIGGNVATNAGGLRLLRYGSLHGNTLGLEVVLPDGTVLDQLQTLRKDNTGYDLKQLFIGSEGTLGIITKVALLTPRRPQSINVAVLACKSFEHVLEVYSTAKECLSEVLSAFEFFDSPSFHLVQQHFSDSIRNPFQNSHPFYVLVEVSGSHADHNEQKLTQFLEHTMMKNTIIDGVVAQDETQLKLFWRLREGIPEAVARHGAVTFKYDVSLPLPMFYEIVDVVRQRLDVHADVAAVAGYGHVGDGNLHLNISAKRYSQELVAQLEPFVYEWTSDRKGSISAEHGIGLMKIAALKYSKTDVAINLMKSIKHLLDPKGILNPYKVIDTI